MDVSIWPTISALLGAAVGGAISYLLNRQQFANQLRLLQAQHKTEFMAEDTARHFLSHKSFTDRSFETLRKSLGGFDDDELRKILVRAGAIRVYRDDGSEWWRLVSRMDEFIERKALERMARESEVVSLRA
jgi:carbamate kinase